jgi:hypothetical protein
MSLVVCSNKESDATVVGRDQSIFKPYSFRNALSSTMTLPKNCQVALESVKYNLDGTISLSGRSRIMYFYYGETPPSTEGLTEAERMDHSTAVPIRIPLVELAKDQVLELTFTELVQQIQDQLNKFVFHPNLRDLVSCSVLRDGTTDELQGIQIDFDQYSATDSVVPTTTKEFGAQIFDDVGENPGWSYENGSFVSNDQSTDDNLPAVALLSDKPISLNEGELIVDFSDANDANVEWRVGLSRYIDRVGGAGLGYWDQDGFHPPYFSDVGSLNGEGPQPGLTKSGGLMFADFLVCRVGDTLKVCHTAVNSTYDNAPTWLNVVMGNSAVVDNYDLATNSANYTKVKFKCRGQQIKIFMLEADNTEHVLYSYSSAYSDESILKPINQSCWSLYPVLSLDRDDTTNGQKLVVETFMGCENISSHNIDDNNNSWYQACEASLDIGEAESLELREWNDEQSDKELFNIQAGVNASGAIELLPSLITRTSTQITPTPDANSMELLGFTTSRKISKYLASPEPANRLRIVSTKVPSLLSTKTMFVRLENFTQNCANARQGNRSKIIAHLPRFDGQVETGRIFHQPNERVYLDLNNSEPLTVNSFDISFCYTNEQYATNLTGQSVVVLHFREKSK